MHELIDEVLSWWSTGRSCGVGTLVDAVGSAPRGIGAALAVGPDGTAVGSVSGGCVESAVYELAVAAREGRAPVLVRYGISSELAYDTGLTCGGVLDVYVERVDPLAFPEFGELAKRIRAGTPVAVATCIEPGSVASGRHLVVDESSMLGSFGDPALDTMARQAALDMLARGDSGMARQADTSVFIASYPSKPRMLIFGAVDFAGALAQLGAFLGYRVTVCDARATFATAERFPGADEVVVDWPHRYFESTATDDRTVVCVLTHDPKFDVPLLERALRRRLAYVGAMGSRAANAERHLRLLRSGLTEEELQRLHAPVGLDLGAVTPQETAVSIVAEVLAARRGATGAPLRLTSGPIHGGRPAGISCPPNTVSV